MNLIDEITTLKERMEFLGETVVFTNKERERLNSVFSAGTICTDNEVVMPLFAYYLDENGNKRCCHQYEFSTKSLECMRKICEDRISETERNLEAFFNGFTLQKVADFINTQFSEFALYKDVRSPEMEKRKRLAGNSKAEIEHGKCAYDKQEFDCVVIRERGYYSGLVIVRKTENGYQITRRVPLCGECCYKCGKDEIFKELKEIAKFMCS